MILYQSVLTLILIIIIFFVTRRLTQELYNILYFIFKNRKIAFTLLAVIFLPGTGLHEVSHFLMATILMLKVVDFTLLPEEKEDRIKLGSVVYQKKDLLRAIIVGIAPIFGGLTFFFCLAYFNLFPSSNMIINLLLIYLIFVVSSTMFSSKQDLKDLIYIIPFLILFAGIFYVFDLGHLFKFTDEFIHSVTNMIYKVNIYLLLSLFINVFLFSVLKLESKLLLKR